MKKHIALRLIFLILLLSSVTGTTNLTQAAEQVLSWRLSKTAIVNNQIDGVGPGIYGELYWLPSGWREQLAALLLLRSFSVANQNILQGLRFDLNEKRAFGVISISCEGPHCIERTAKALNSLFDFEPSLTDLKSATDVLLKENRFSRNQGAAAAADILLRTLPWTSLPNHRLFTHLRNRETSLHDILLIRDKINSAHDMVVSIIDDSALPIEQHRLTQLSRSTGLTESRSREIRSIDMRYNPERHIIIVDEHNETSQPLFASSRVVEIEDLPAFLRIAVDLQACDAASDHFCNLSIQHIYGRHFLMLSGQGNTMKELELLSLDWRNELSGSTYLNLRGRLFDLLDRYMQVLHNPGQLSATKYAEMLLRSWEYKQAKLPLKLPNEDSYAEIRDEIVADYLNQMTLSSLGFLRYPVPESSQVTNFKSRCDRVLAPKQIVSVLGLQ